MTRQLAPVLKRCESAESRRLTGEILAALNKGGDTGPYCIRVYLVDDPMVNALALPGGQIVIYRGLIEKLSTPHELAAVVSHEIQHVVQRHSTKALMRGMAFWLTASLLIGDSSGSLIQLAGSVTELSYRREDEEAADREGMRMMQRARLDPRAMVNLFRMLKEESGDYSKLTRYVSTHPMPEERMEQAKRVAAEMDSYSPVPLLSAQPWPPQLRSCSAQVR